MLQIISFGISALLALAGIALAAFGIAAAEFKPVILGTVLIFGAGVFAMLYVGTRWTSRKSE